MGNLPLLSFECGQFECNNWQMLRINIQYSWVVFLFLHQKNEAISVCMHASVIFQLLLLLC